MTRYKQRKPKTLNCKECGEEVHNCGAEAAWVICWKCVAKGLQEFNNNNKNLEDVQSHIGDS